MKKEFQPVAAQYDPNLDTYNDVVLFPKKMEKAKTLFNKYAIMQKNNSLSALQTELLNTFALEPTEQQMQELKAFLHQLFGEQLLKVEEEMVDC